MCRRSQPRSEPAGFTLLEMIVVLFIIAALTGVAAFSFLGLDESEALRKPAAELEFMVREAVRRASALEQPQVIQFEKNAFSINYRGDSASLSYLSGTGDRHWLRRTQGPDHMTIMLRHWGAKEWQPAKDQHWIVQPGLCEPLTVRFELEGSWLEMEFHPLTGAVMHRESHFPPS
jgi:prepilin-type N-terminal cleavage/methylation domain-containing protein